MSGSSGAAYMRLHVRPIARSLSIDSGLASCQVSSSVGSTGIHGSGQERVPGSRTDPVGPCTGSPPPAAIVSRLVSGVTYTRSGKHVRGRTHCGASSGCRIRRLRAARPTKGCGTHGSSSARLPREVRRPARACFRVEALARSSRNPGTPSICAALNVRDDIPVSVRTGGCGHRRLTPIASYRPTDRAIDRCQRRRGLCHGTCRPYGF